MGKGICKLFHHRDGFKILRVFLVGCLTSLHHHLHQVRLAEAYIALGAGYSNDACNALQRAIQLDPRHPTARQMLIRELRRDHRAAASGQGGSHHERTSTESNVAPLETVDTAETDMAFGSNSREPSAPSSQTSRVYENVDDPSPQSPDSSSFFDNVQSQFTKGIRWYHSQSEDRRTMIHVLFLLLILYVAFGGRFGFEHQGHTAYRKGNYGTGNAYDQFYGRKSSSYEPSRHTNYHTSSSNNYYKQQYSSYEQPRRSSSSHDGRNYYSASFFDLSPILLILMGAAYLCHRNGIPVAELVSLFVWNFLLRGRRRYRRAGRGLGHHGMFRFRPRY